MRKWISAFLVAAAGVTLAAGQDARDVLTRRVMFAPPSLELPPTPGHVAVALAGVAAATHVSLGFEALPDQPYKTLPGRPPVVSLAGKTLEQSLNIIIEQEPRYVWTLDDGVVHVRPRDVMTDADDQLRHPLDFHLQYTTLSDALWEVKGALNPSLRGGGRGGSGPPPGDVGQRHFAVDVSAGTLMDVLDAIVKAHGDSSWSVVPTGNPALPYRITFHAFDGWSISG